MTIEIPNEHRRENLKLNAEPYVDLFHIQLQGDPGGDLFLKNGDPIQWSLTGSDDDKINWESYPLSFSGYEMKADGQLSRPTLQVLNPGGVFSGYVLDGSMDKAMLFRYRVLRSDLEANRAVFQMNQWIIWQCTSITKNYMIFECRNNMDGNNFYVPARQYMPPEFPTVVLK